jgi:hypothetical protein
VTVVISAAWVVDSIRPVASAIPINSRLMLRLT